MLKWAAAKVGATVEDDSAGSHICYQVVAPAGKWWVESDGPHLVVATRRGDKLWLAEAIADGVERIGYGLYDEPVDADR
jgi:hypothetical protein